MEIIETFKTPVARFLLNEDVKKIAAFAQTWRKAHPSVHQTNRGGYQSPALPLDLPIFKSLRKEAKRCFNEFREMFYYSTMFEIANMWLNINPPKTYNAPHIHPFSCLSSAFYIKAPQKSGNLVFHNDIPITSFLKAEYITDHGWYNSTDWVLPMKENYFYVFPPWLRHSVESNESKEDRISISMNAKEWIIKDKQAIRKELISAK